MVVQTGAWGKDYRWVDSSQGKLATQTASDHPSYLKDYFLPACRQDPAGPLRAVWLGEQQDRVPLLQLQPETGKGS